MYHYKTSKVAVETLFEYNKFSKEYNQYIQSLTEELEDCPECVQFRRKKHTLDQLADDLNRSYNKVKADIFDTKIKNTQRQLEDVKADFMKGMLNDGFSIKQPSEL
jgi:hypothetical protein